MMPRTVLRAAAATAVALGAAIGLSACTTPLDRAWGLSQRAHAAQMIANPEAGKSDLAAPRLDGTSTDAALSKYRTHESRVDEGPAPPVINVGIGARQ
jgi:hypothetical protein